MQISLTPASAQHWTGDVLIAGICMGELQKQINAIQPIYAQSLIERLKAKNFSGKTNEIACFEILQGNTNKLILVGLGEANKLSINEFRNATALGARECVGNKGILGILFPWESCNSHEAGLAVLEACRLSLFKDLRFRSDPEVRKIPSEIVLIGLNESEEKNFGTFNPICSGVELARELVDSPANEITPTALATISTDLANEYDLEIKVLEKEDCLKRGMGAYLAVSQGSDLAPKFIHLTYHPKEEVKQRLVLVGKGLTFDSGGYNLKVGASQIDLMKFDMGGSATVLGTARAISEIRPKNIEVHFIIASCENMINGSAIHPGDIVKASNGKTIEINNTDAEGRLTLADALIYACELKPDAIVDLATLTGACIIALGDEIAGLWTNNDKLAEDLQLAANNAGEGIWRMPLHSNYKDGLKSLLADLKNTGPRSGGSITAALFLKEFISESIPWAHIDIAGTVWSEKGKGMDPAGATGYGVRTLINWIISQE